MDFPTQTAECSPPREVRIALRTGQHVSKSVCVAGRGDLSTIVRATADVEPTGRLSNQIRVQRRDSSEHRSHLAIAENIPALGTVGGSSGQPGRPRGRRPRGLAQPWPAAGKQFGADALVGDPAFDVLRFDLWHLTSSLAVERSSEPTSPIRTLPTSGSPGSTKTVQFLGNARFSYLRSGDPREHNLLGLGHALHALTEASN